MEKTKPFDIRELVEHLGGFGRFQIFVFILGCYAAAIPGIMVVTIIFVGYEPSFRCLVPACESPSNSTYKEDFLNFTIPYDSKKEKYDTCDAYDALNSTSTEYNLTQSCIPSHFDSSSQVKCSSYVYDDSQFISTTVTEFELVCDRAWLQPMAVSVYMVGMLIGAIVLGDLGDRIGRRKGFFVAALLAAIGGIASSLSQSYYMFLASRVITGTGSIALFQISFVIVMEWVSPSWRTFVGIMIEVPFALGEASFAIFAYYIRSWRYLQLVSTIPGLLLLSYIFILPESIRWLIFKGKIKEAKTMIKRIEKVNKITVPKHTYASLEPEEEMTISVVSGNQSTKKNENEDLKEQKRQMIDLLRYPKTRYRTLNLMFCWIVITLGYYGLSANSAKIGGDIFVSFVGIMLIEIPSYVLAYLVLDRLGRKGTLCLTLLLGGLALVISGFISPEINWLIVTLSMVGKCGISAAFAVVYVYTAEIYPTPYRSLGIGTCSMSARIGGILAPFIANLDKIYRPLPPFIFGVLSLISGVLIFFLPETLGSELPQTLEQSEDLGADQSVFFFSCFSRKRKVTITPQ